MRRSDSRAEGRHDMTAGELVRIEVILFIAGIAIAVFWKLVTGAITMRGLLTDKI